MWSTPPREQDRCLRFQRSRHQQLNLLPRVRRLQSPRGGVCSLRLRPWPEPRRLMWCTPPREQDRRLRFQRSRHLQLNLLLRGRRLQTSGGGVLRRHILLSTVSGPRQPASKHCHPKRRYTHLIPRTHAHARAAFCWVLALSYTVLLL